MVQKNRLKQAAIVQCMKMAANNALQLTQLLSKSARGN